MNIRIPLRLDIAGSFTDLPGYLNGGGHIVAPLDYYIHVRVGEVSDEPVVNGINSLVSHDFGLPEPDDLSIRCDLSHGGGLGTSSSTLVGIIAHYSQTYNQPMSHRDMVKMSIRITESQRGFCGRQDEISAVYGSTPLSIEYNGEFSVTPLIFPEQFKENIEQWFLYYIPRTVSGQAILDYETKLKADVEPLNTLRKLMLSNIASQNWNAFYINYRKHWLLVEVLSPLKINDAIRRLRSDFGCFIRPCGAGGGGYVLIHGDASGLEGAVPVKLRG